MTGNQWGTQFLWSMRFLKLQVSYGYHFAKFVAGYCVTEVHWTWTDRAPALIEAISLADTCPPQKEMTMFLMMRWWLGCHRGL